MNICVQPPLRIAYFYQENPGVILAAGTDARRGGDCLRS